MKNRLTEIYNKYLKIDPDIKDYPGLEKDINTICNTFSGRSRFNSIYNMYAKSMISVRDVNYTGEKPITGEKVFISRELSLVASQDSYFPWENDLFRTDSSYIKFLIIELILEKYQCSIYELSEVYNKNIDLLDDIKPELENTLRDQEFFGYYGGDPNNNFRSKSIKKRKLEFIKFYDKRSYYGNDFSVVMKDIKTKKEFIVYTGYGWSLYPSLDIMNSRLTDLEAYWMNEFDTQVKNIDKEISTTEKHLEMLKGRKNKFLNSLSDYSKRVKEVLWKDF